MKKYLVIGLILSLALGGIYLAKADKNLGAWTNSSVQIGTTPANGDLLQTNGTTSTWVATSTLAGGMQTPWLQNINANGYTLNGSSTASGNLTLMSTSNATKGKILFGTSAYDEVNNRLGIGIVSPTKVLQMVSSGADDGFFLYNTSLTPLVGFYQSSSDKGEIAVKDGGVNRIYLSANAGNSSYINSGNVGIGTTSPSAQLTILKDGIAATQSDAYGLRLENTTAATSDVKSQYSPPLVFSSNTWGPAASSQNTSFRMFNRPPNTTSNLFGELAVQQSKGGGAYSDVMVYNTFFNSLTLGISVSALNFGNANVFVGRDSSHNLLLNAFTDILFQTSAATKMTLLNNGNVGIGTTSPGEKLTIAQSADDKGIKIYGYDDQSTSYLSMKLSPAGQPVITGSDTMRFYVGATQALILSNAKFEIPGTMNFVTTNGNIGAGIAAPTSRIHGVTTLSAATGDEIAYQLNYTTNKVTSGNDTGLLINMTDTASPGTSLLLDAQVGGVSKFSVSNTGTTTASQFRLSALNTAPATATSTGTLGEIRIVADYIYVAINTNTWVRSALSSW